HFDVGKIVADDQIKKVLSCHESKRRKFVQSIDLQCYLKNLGKGNQKYNINTSAPYDVKKANVILIGTESDIDSAK
ncbi:MAG: hypothetical protein MHPSP_004050, partial [Paramarteilia canceri]